MVQQEEKINVLITLFAFLPLVDQAIEWLSWNIGITLLFLRMIELLSWLITNGLEIVISNRLLSWKISYIYCAFLVVTVRLCEEATDLTSRMNFIKLKATDSFFFLCSLLELRFVDLPLIWHVPFFCIYCLSGYGSPGCHAWNFHSRRRIDIALCCFQLMNSFFLQFNRQSLSLSMLTTFQKQSKEMLARC